MTSLLAELLPAPVVAVEVFDDPLDATLYPEEAAVVARSVRRRQQEFTTVRHCARTALRQLGVPVGPILPGHRGAPLWPPGVVGSMTHCTGFRGSAVAHVRDVLALGIDAEPAEPLPSDLIEAIALPAERDIVAGLAATRPGVPWDRLLFSAKEAVYKAWFPVTGVFLDFPEARIVLEPSGTFTARLLVPDPRNVPDRLTGFNGRWTCRSGLVLTAVRVPHPGTEGRD